MRKRRGGGVSVAVPEMEKHREICTNPSRGQQQYKAPALPGHRAALVEGLFSHLVLTCARVAFHRFTESMFALGGKEAFQSEPDVEQTSSRFYSLPYLRKRGGSPRAAGARILPSHPQHLPARSRGPLSHQGLFLLFHLPQVKLLSFSRSYLMFLILFAPLKQLISSSVP